MKQSQQKPLFGIRWIAGLVLFLLMTSWMLYDILQRDHVTGERSDVLVMGTNAGFKPFEYKQGGEIVGFDIDLAREIAASMGKTLKIEDMSFDGLLPALSSGQIDMAVAGMSVTPERQKNALFSDPYYSAAQRMIVRKGSDITNRHQLAHRKIGVQLGTTGDTLAASIQGAHISKFPTAPSVLTELSTGGVDVVILDDAPALQYTPGFHNLTILPGELSSESYAIAIKQGNHDLLRAVNATITAMKQDGRYDALLQKYFPSTPKKEQSP